MSDEEFGARDLPVKEYGERTLSAARLYSLLRQECGIDDPWHVIVVSLCSFERMHLKDGWEFVLLNRKDIEDVGHLFETSNSPEELKDGLIALKEQDLLERMERQDP